MAGIELSLMKKAEFITCLQTEKGKGVYKKKA